MRLQLAIMGALLAGSAAAAEPPSLAVFDFSLIDTSPAPPTPVELDRLHRLGDQLRGDLAGRYRIVDTEPVAARLSGMAHSQ